MVNRIRNNQNTRFPCSLCCKNVNNNNLAILCSYCNLWSHNKCSLVDCKQYKYHQLNPDVPFLCLKCKEDNIPFMKMNKFEYASHILKDTNIVDTNFAQNSS